MTNPDAFPSPDRAEQNEKLGAQITLLAGQMNVGNYRLLKLIAEFDERKGWSGAGTVRSCADWLNWKCGIAIGAAREKVRVAHCLAELPLIDAAFATGEISYSKVRAMTRVATPENEEYLLMIAQHGTASHMEQVVSKYRKVQRTCADSAEREQRDARKLLYYQDDDGMWVIHARLPACTGHAGQDLSFPRLLRGAPCGIPSRRALGRWGRDQPGQSGDPVFIPSRAIAPGVLRDTRGRTLLNRAKSATGICHALG
jgi:hypothetical protein